MAERTSAKTTILNATKALLWEHGYKGTSPKMVMSASGAGQGSLYHHFSGKPDLAQQALSEVEQAMLASAKEDIFNSSTPPEEQLKAYLQLPRQALKGCRIGRMAYDPDIINCPDLRTPIAHYFSALHELIQPCIDQLIHTGTLPQSTDSHTLSTTIIAVVQGGFLLARAHNDASKMDEAINGVMCLIFEGKKS